MGWWWWWWCKVIIVSNPTAVEVVLSCIEVVVGVLTIGVGGSYPCFLYFMDVQSVGRAIGDLFILEVGLLLMLYYFCSC